MIYALTGQKGGSGKTTLAVCLAAEALARGARVLLIDADPQGTARTWGDVAAENGYAAPTVVAHGASMHRPDQLPQLATAFDTVFIDCPPRAGDVQRSALMVADLVLLPCGPSAPDAWALASSLEGVQEAQILGPELGAAIVVTKKQARTAVGQGARDVLEQSGLPVLAAELGYRVAYQEAMAAGRGVTTFAPKSEAAEELRALFQEVVAMAELLNVQTPKRSAKSRKPAKGAARGR